MCARITMKSMKNLTFLSMAILGRAQTAGVVCGEGVSADGLRNSTQRDQTPRRGPARKLHFTLLPPLVAGDRPAPLSRGPNLDQTPLPVSKVTVNHEVDEGTKRPAVNTQTDQYKQCFNLTLCTAIGEANTTPPSCHGRWSLSQPPDFPQYQTCAPQQHSRA